MKIEGYFDPDEIRKMCQGLHIEVKKTPKAMQDKWTQLTKGDDDGVKATGCNVEKRKVLSLSLTHPMTWDTLVVEQWEFLEQEDKDGQQRLEILGGGVPATGRRRSDGLAPKKQI